MRKLPFRPCRSLTRAVLLTLSILLASCATTTSSHQDDANLKALQEVLHTSFATTSGGQKSLSDFQGRIILIHFFSSWCTDCAQQVAGLKHLGDSFERSDFSIIGVAVSDDPIKASEFASRLNIPYPVLLDSSGDLKQFFSIDQLPVSLVLDRGGVPVQFQDPHTGAVTSKLEGARRWDTEGPVAMIAGLIEGQ